MTSVEDRVQAALSAAAELATREIRTAPPLRLPPAPAAGDRRRRAPGRGVRWAMPLTAAAAVVALALSLMLVKGMQNGRAVPPAPATSAVPAPAAGPGGVPRYYAALQKAGASIMVGDSVTGRLVATVRPPASKTVTTYFEDITAAADDRTFAVLAVSYPTASLQAPGVFAGTTTVSWYEVRIAPGTAHPARLSKLTIQPESTRGFAVAADFATALSASGRELAVTGVSAAGGLAVRVFSVATGRLLREWTTNDPSLSPLSSSISHGLTGRPALTWIDADRVLAVDTASGAPSSGARGFGVTATVRELSVAGPASGDLLTDGKVAWSVRTWEFPQTLLQACAGGADTGPQLISADGSTLGCATATGPDADPRLSFLSYPLGTGPPAAGKARTDYQVTPTAKLGVSTPLALWISPSGDALVGAWNTHPPGNGDVNGLYIGVMSRGTFTPLRFPSGFYPEVLERIAEPGIIAW